VGSGCGTFFLAALIFIAIVVLIIVGKMDE
jgi:hypothetical protein